MEYRRVQSSGRVGSYRKYLKSCPSALLRILQMSCDSPRHLVNTEECIRRRSAFVATCTDAHRRQVLSGKSGPTSAKHTVPNFSDAGFLESSPPNIIFRRYAISRFRRQPATAPRGRTDHYRVNSGGSARCGITCMQEPAHVIVPPKIVLLRNTLLSCPAKLPAL
jgi:hypothetical protein